MSETETKTHENDPSYQEVSFTVSGDARGYLKCLPIAIGVAGYGLLFGVLARQAGLSVLESALMSATVLAGAAQLIAVDLWASPLPLFTIIVTTAIVNLRYVLMGAALRPWFSQLTPIQAYGSVFFTADENWALTMKEFKDGHVEGAFLLGSGLAIWTLWIAATIIGAVLGTGITDPSVYGLDFVLTAVFLTLVVGFWEGTETAPAWVVAAIVALVSTNFLPGRWYILLGGLAASFTEVLQDA